MKYPCTVKSSASLLVCLFVALTTGAFAQSPSGDVVISSNTTWAAGTYPLNSLTVSNGATLTIGGGSTISVAAGVTVTGNSNIVLQGANTAVQVNGSWQGAGSTIDAASIQVDAGSSINADGQGYAVSAGPGGSPAGATSIGGSYGGVGGSQYANAAATYGSATAPTDLGSGGNVRAGNSVTGTGGGAIRLIVSGALTNNGTISANGGNGAGDSGSGSGGSVWITTGTLAGSGSILANGGSGGEASGGGGRIAVYYNGANSSFTGFATSTASGGSAAAYYLGANGTVAFFDTSSTNYNLNIYQDYQLPAGANLSYNAITVQAGAVLTIGGGSQVTLAGALTVSGTVLVLSANNTAQVNGSWQGAGSTIDAASVQVNASGSINADGQGYAVSAGPGGSPAGATSIGGSYGGVGGSQYANAAATYGSATAPTDLGSGGNVRCCNAPAGAGGGAIRLVVSGALTNNGTISANGGHAAGDSGSGSGGSVWITTGTLAGSGSILANGGSGGEATGGGGRIAVYYNGANSSFTGFATSTASGGSAAAYYSGANGTAAFFDTSSTNYNLNIYQDYQLPAGTNLSYNAITVQAGAVLSIGGGSQVTVAGALTVSGTVLVLSANNTAQVNGSWQGAGSTIDAASVQVNASGSINADGQGYAVSAGPGGSPAGATSIGGSYGGVGGSQYANAAATYGSAATPTDLGSGGNVRSGNSVAGTGGGAIRLIVSGTLTNNGTISANGGNAAGFTGSGSGGSVWIIAGTLAGSGSILANGGSGGESSGGGGRIAVYYITNSGFNLNLVLANGGSTAAYYLGAKGTVNVSNTPTFLWVAPSSTTTVLYGSELLQWFAGAVDVATTTVDVIASGPQILTIGSALNANSSLNWDTATVPDGRYELRLVFHDGNGNDIQEVPRTVVINNSVVWHSGIVTGNQEWTANQVQGLDGTVIIPSGVTVTIDPGAIVKALPGVQIVVESGGILNALGGASNPVIFTAFDDSSVGGDTDFTGGLSVPTPGDWNGISVQAGGQFNSNSNTNIRYVQSTQTGTLPASEAWLANQLYLVTGTVVVPSGMTLTIQPGAIVKFGANAGITVQPGGQLIAQGTLAQPIYFTSINDNSVGGTATGSSGTPAPGDWGTILIDGAQASLVHVQMYYGSGPVSASTPDVIGMIETTGKSSVTIADCAIAQGFWNGIQTGYPDGGGDTVTITNTILWGLEDRAINAWPGSVVHVVNDTIDGNTTGILAHGGTVDVENTIVSNSKAPGGAVQLCCGGTFSSIAYSDVWTSVAGVPNYGGLADPTGTNGNISANPVFVNEPQGNFVLNYGSPAIDAANGTVPNYPLTDANGNFRYNDPQVTNKTGVPDSNGNYPDMGPLEFVATEPSNIDMTVSSVTGPSAAVAGSMVQVSWTVTNIGTGVAYGPWHDAVYLVRDADTNPVAVLAAQLPEGTGAVLGPGASYTATATIRVPGTVVGNAQWEVKTNVLGEIFEGPNTANNTGISLDTVAVDLPALTMNSPAASGSFAGAGQSWWYKITPGANQNVSLNLNLTGGASAGVVQLFVGQGYVPTPQNFDIQQTQWNSPSASLTISNTSSQIYYVTAYAQSLTNSPAPFTISATAVSFSLASVQPGSAVNTGSATLTFMGGGFTNSATYQLVGPGGTINPTSVFVSDSAHAEVTFNMSGLAIGSYTAQVLSNGSTVTLSNALTVTAPSTATVTNGNGQIQVTLSTPEAFRSGFPSEVTLNYQNVGATDIAAPLIQLTATGGTFFPVPPACTGCDANFGLKYQNTFNSGAILGISHEGPAGVLPAGAQGSASFLVTPGSGSGVTFGIQTEDVTPPINSTLEALLNSQGSNLLIGTVETVARLGASAAVTGRISLTPLTNVGEFPTAAAFCRAMQPPNANSAGFTRTCMQFLVGAGFQYFPLNGNPNVFISYALGFLSASGIDQLLAADATALSQAGIYESDSGHLMGFELIKDGFNIFNERYHQGAFGFGPSHPFDITAVLFSAVPTVVYPNGDTRPFNTPNPANATQYLGGVGDYGVLTIEPDGSWMVTESNGYLYHFVVDPVSNTLNRHILDYIQDLHGNHITLSYTNDLVTSVADSAGNTLTFVYDTFGHIVQATDPVGRITTYTYNAENDNRNDMFLTSVTTTSGTTTLTWNEGGVDGVGYFDDSCVTTYCEPAIGVTSIAFPDGTHEYFTYDALGRLASEYLDDGNETVNFTYGSDGTVTETDALGNSTILKANEYGEVLKFTDPLSDIIQMSYDPEGKLTGYQESLGISAAGSYDSLSNLTGYRDPLGNSLQFAFGGDGYLQSFSDDLGNATTYTYDASYDNTGVTYSDGSTAPATFDSQGNVLTRTNRRGHTTTYSYDPHNLILSKTYANGTQVSYTYDNHRNLASATGSAGTISFAYDTADRLTRTAYPNGQSIQYSYNAGGQRTSLTDSTGFTVNYSYDSAGRLSQVTSTAGSLVVSYIYDADGRVMRRTLGNGDYITYSYDAAGKLLRLSNYTSAGGTIGEYDYTYDAAGRVVGMNSPSGAWTYVHDASGQITSVTMPGGTVQYTYDAAGNRLSSTNGGTAVYLANNLNEYVSAGSAAYTYDADGNLISGGGRTYTYDDENRLVAESSATDTWTYQYDGLGNRLSATHNGTLTQYLTDLSGFGNVEAEFDSTGHLISHYAYGLDLAGAFPAAGTPVYYHFDGSGNTTQLTNSSGAVVNSYSYLPFGEKLSATGTATNPFTYAGEFGVMDEGSGLYFMRNRWYNPSLGRFQQIDPIGILGDVNLYRYAGNDPLTFVDPSGNDALDTLWNSAKTFSGSAGGEATKIMGEGLLTAKDSYDLANSINDHDTLGIIHDTALVASRPLSFLPPEGPQAPLVVVAKSAGKIDTVSKIAFNGGAALWYYPWSAPVHNPTQPRPDALSYLIPNFGCPGCLFPEIPIPDINIPIAKSKDPNGKLTSGFGTQGFMPPNVAIPYTIYFENQSTATAPAQKVTVTDQLTANLDWSTLQLNQIEFNNVTVNVPAGLQNYSTQVNVSTDPNPVNVTVAFNSNTGVLTSTMQSVSPTTGGAPANPLAGFLPPNNASNQGTGFVTISVSPKSTLGNGAAIANQASIVFDANAAIATNTVTNTIDSTTPTSAVSPLPATSTTQSFSVSWTGSDPGGSGIAVYNIFVSIDGGAYATWMANTTATAAAYTGFAGHQYSFYSMAVNNVGTIQTNPGTAQAAMIAASAAPGVCDVNNYGAVTISDIQSVINQALGAASPVSDLNHDGVVNVIDAQIVMNAMLGLGCTL